MKSWNRECLNKANASFHKSVPNIRSLLSELSSRPIETMAKRKLMSCLMCSFDLWRNKKFPHSPRPLFRTEFRYLAYRYVTHAWWIYIDDALNLLLSIRLTFSLIGTHAKLMKNANRSNLYRALHIFHSPFYISLFARPIIYFRRKGNLSMSLILIHQCPLFFQHILKVF